jgi:hypothetical protein
MKSQGGWRRNQTCLEARLDSLSNDCREWIAEGRDSKLNSEKEALEEGTDVEFAKSSPKTNLPIEERFRSFRVTMNQSILGTYFLSRAGPAHILFLPQRQRGIVCLNLRAEETV